MQLFAEEEAKQRQCPHVHDLGTCIGSACMGWVQTQRRIERENHSGGSAMMQSLGVKRGQRVKREGPNGCTGILVLEARGYCGCNHYEKEDDDE